LKSSATLAAKLSASGCRTQAEGDGLGDLEDDGVLVRDGVGDRVGEGVVVGVLDEVLDVDGEGERDGVEEGVREGVGEEVGDGDGEHWQGTAPLHP
jgi:hypothetical protein